MLVCNFTTRAQILSANHKWSVTSLDKPDYCALFMLPLDEKTLCVIGSTIDECPTQFIKFYQSKY